MHFSTLFQFCPRCGSHLFIQNTEKSKHCEVCDFEMFVNASAGVAVFIVNDEGQLLVCKRAKDPEKGTFDLPGGFVDENETIEQAVSREIMEELNVRVVSSTYLFSLPNQYEYSGWTIPTIDLFFRCEIDSFNNIKPDDDVASVQFIPIDQLNADDFGLNSIRKAVAFFQQAKST